ncbi:hypothetical protein BDN72DRAFT_881225 [Pluteus cervinus]|uniref:Uncharacterized protein n=1 Tax=Pluteus cervinus TaxID=181527 RepID=A0ACD3AGC2_9AGAR|nr:hypothetical protein BDN72DRAFT_881225 [Pluteus cervinus]
MSHLPIDGEDDIEESDVDSDIPNAPNTPEIEEIDKEIEELTQRIHLLKVKRNSFVPISRLQPELLISVFFFLQSVCLERPEEYYQWIKITHVAQCWRKLAHGTSSLWSGIVQAQERHKRLAEVSLQRAGYSDLDIIFHDLNGSKANLDFFLHSVTDHIHRVRSLDVRLSNDEGPDGPIQNLGEVTECLSQSFPVLKELNVCGLHYMGVNVDYKSLAGFIIAPNLHRLRLLHTQVKLPWSAYSEITHLELSNARYSFGSEVAFTVSPLLRILAHTTKLRALTLDWNDLSTDEEHVQGPIYLTQLSNVDLDIGCEEFTAILSVIKIPPTTTILAGRWSHLSKVRFDNFFNVLADCFLDGEIKIHRFDYREESEIHLRLWAVGQEISPRFITPRSSLLAYLENNTDWIPGFLSSKWFSLSHLHSASLIRKDRGPLPHIHRYPSLFSTLGSTPLSTLLLTKSFVPLFTNYIEAHPESFTGLVMLSIHEYKLSIETLVRLSAVLECRANSSMGRLKTLALYYLCDLKGSERNSTLIRLSNVASDVILKEVEAGELDFYDT